MTSPSLPTGQWVQYNPSTDSPRAAPPSTAEQGIGKIMQAFTAQGQQFYQVVWNPGDQSPQTAIYHQSQLTPITQQQVTQVVGQMNAGTYEPSLPTQSSQYVQPNIPIQGLPPALQDLNDTFSAGAASTSPTLQQTG